MVYDVQALSPEVAPRLAVQALPGVFDIGIEAKVELLEAREPREDEDLVKCLQPEHGPVREVLRRHEASDIYGDHAKSTGCALYDVASGHTQRPPLRTHVEWDADCLELDTWGDVEILPIV